MEVLIECANCYLDNSEIVFSLLSSLMKLAVKDMTTKHEQIKEFMMKVEASSDYFIHKIAEGTHTNMLEFIRNAKYSKALARSD